MSYSRHSVKIGAAIVLAAVLFAGSTPASALSSNSVDTAVTQVTALGKAFKVNIVTVDLTDPTIELVPVLAAGGIGHVESFSSMVEREDAVAAVNGTFFNAYESNPYIRYPNGTLLKSGELVHSGENQTLFLNKDKVPDIQFVNLDMTVRVGEGSGSFTVEPWGVNKDYGNTAGQIVWYTSNFGSWIGFPNGTKVVVSEGSITRITEDAVQVPDGGYVLFIGNSADNRKYILPKLKVGNKVTQELLAKGDGGGRLDAKEWLAAIGVGPKLVTDGVVDLNYSRDGFTDPKITLNAAVRSFVGVDGSDRLVMGTVASATMPELAAIAAGLQLKEAMNMDGGSSSALYANDRMLTAPGRDLSNALVVRKLDKPKVQIELNGKYVPDYHGFIVSDTTVVPIRPFITALKAGFQWDDANRTAIITSAGVTIKLQDGSSTAMVNGKSVPVPVPLQILDDSRMYVPLRFVAETFKSKVDWDNRLYRASVSMP